MTLDQPNHPRPNPLPAYRERGPEPRDLLHAAGCAAVTFTLLLVVWPWINLPFNDDWSFAFTVKRLLETGHLQYNHWSALPILSNVFWGVGWAKAFGFSFTVLRWSTLPFALGAVMLTHLLARRAGLRAAHAGFVAVLLGTSPLFLPYAASFMTDTPGLFFTLAALFALVAAAESPRDRTSLGWLAVGVGAAIVGGVGRQSVFLVPLVLLPYLLWLSRSRRLLASVAGASWVLVALAMFLTLRWFARQPHALADLPLADDLRSARADTLTPLQACIGMALTAALLTLPALLPGKWLRTSADKHLSPPPGLGGARLLLAAVVVLAVLCLSYNAGPDALAPWMDNTLTPAGILGTSEIFGSQPISLTVNLRMLITAAVLVVLVIDSRLLAGALVQPRRSAAAAGRWLLYPDAVALPAYALFLMAYLAALLPRCTRHMVYDRYLLPVLPVVAIAACLRQQRAGRLRPPVAAWVLVCVFALFAVVSLQDLTALGRVRIAARDQLLSNGIPPQQIEMGIEFDHWAQLQATGFIPEVSLGRFDKPPRGTPDLKPVIRLEYPRPPHATSLRTVHYTSWLPPFRRTAYLDWLR